MADGDRKVPRSRFRLPGTNGAPLSQVAKAVLATVILLIVGGIVEPSTLTLGAIMTLVPFVAVLAVASIGQHVVIQQRGLDLSVAGVMSFAAVIVTAYPGLDAGIGQTLFYILLALVMGLVVGAINGVLVAILGVPALVTTIGMNSLMLGATMYVSGGFAQQVPPPLNDFGLFRLLGIPTAVYVMVIVAAVAAFVVARSTIGRHFTATSVNPAAAVAVGIPLDRYRIATYMAAGFFYAAAGVLLASYVLSPTVFCGLPYLLATIAAVVVGGNSIGGGQRGSIVATVIGALFLTYLGQLVLAIGFGTSAQNIVQALIIIASFAVPEIAARRRLLAVPAR
jgi:ribose/xylose/arabinose/galactoside ABC-type transport system permease subunit